MKKADICFYGKEYVYRIHVDANISNSYWLYQKIQGKLQPILELYYDHEGWSWNGSKQCYDSYHYTNGRIKKFGIYLFYGCDPWCLLFQKEEEHNSYRAYMLPKEEVKIGRSKQCHIQFDRKYVSTIHAQMYMQGKWMIEDNNSKNGSYVNKNKVSKHPLKIGDCIHVMGLEIIFLDPYIVINIGKNVKIHGLSEYKEQKLTENFVSKIEVHKELIYIPKIEKKIIEIRKPEDKIHQEEYPFWLTMGPAFAMGVTSMMVGIFMVVQSIQSKQPIWQNMPSILMMQSMAVSTIVWPCIQRKYDIKKAKKEALIEYQEYQLYCDQKQKEIDAYIENIKAIQSKKKEIWVSLQKGYWFVDLNHSFFGQCFLGTGNQEIQIPLHMDQQGYGQQDGRNYKLFNELEKQHIKNTLMDIFLDIKKYKRIGVYGEQSIQVMFYLLLQLCKTHDPKKVKIIMLTTIENIQTYPISFLPHFFFNQQRNIFTNVNQLSYLDQLLDTLNKQKVATILILMYPKLQNNFSMDFILQRYPSIYILQQEKRKEDLYSIYLTYLCAQEKDEVDLETEQMAQKVQLYNWKEEYMKYVYLRLSSVKSKSFLKQKFDFFDLYECGNVEMLDVGKRWSHHQNYHTLKAIIGIDEHGDKIYLDAHETKHGPHGIVAGMTGSGKSEFLLSYILSLCVNYSCEKIAFLLIDYKGGSMAEALSKLPHVSYVLTNLDQNCMQRFQNALQAEIITRQKYLKKAMNDYHRTSMDIDEYYELYMENKVSIPMPHLFIVADEFAELKTQQPEFMKQIKQAARIGRSLGIHLILATQKPYGCIDDEIWSNSRFHICLKVQDRNDSMDMLKKDDACFLQTSGDYYLQVGNDELFIKGHCSYMQAPYIPYDVYNPKRGKGIACYDNFMNQVSEEILIHKVVEKKTQLSVICEYIQKQSKLLHYKEPFFMNPNLIFYERKHLSKSLQLSLGKMEESKNRIQVPFYLFKEDFRSMLLIGRQNSGRCLFVKQWLYECIRLSKVQKQWLIILDGSEYKFQEYDSLSIVTIININEVEKMKSFIYQFEHHILKEEQSFCIRMIIYDYVVWKEIYKDFEEHVSSWMIQSKDKDIQYCITLHSLEGISYRFLSYFENRFCFQLQDHTDYQQLFHNIDIFPSLQKGNGIFIRNHRIYNFQVVPYTKEEQKRICNEYKSKDKIFKIPLLPKRIFPQYCKNKLYIGMNITTKEHCWITLPSTVFIIRAFQMDQDYQKYLHIYQERFGKNIKIVTDFTMINENETCVCFLNLRSLMDASMYPMYIEWLYTAHFIWIGKGLYEAVSLLKLPVEYSHKELDENEALWYREGECAWIKMLEMREYAG